MRRLIVAFAVVVVLAGTTFAAPIPLFNVGAIASVQNPAPPGTVFPPGIGGLVGGIGGPVGFVMPTAGMFHYTIQDCCLVGDVYEGFVDGAYVGMTLPVPIGGPVLSSGTFDIFLAAGAHTVDAWDIILSYINDPAGSPFGGGVVPPNYSPAGLTLIGTYDPVPEPGTLSLLGLGILAAFGWKRRK